MKTIFYNVAFLCVLVNWYLAGRLPRCYFLETIDDTISGGSISKPMSVSVQERISNDVNRSLFDPGSLSMDRAETIFHCWTGSTRRDEVKAVPNVLYSKEYNASTVIITKIGSSTQKRILLDHLKFQQTFGPNLPAHGHGLFHAVTTRDPMSRFISGYREAMIRFGIGKEHTWSQQQFDVPRKYNRFHRILDSKNRTEVAAIWKGGTPDLLKLKAQIFEAFVEDFDPEDSFDNHLMPQMQQLWDFKFSQMKKFDLVLETKNLTDGLNEFIQRIGAPAVPEKLQGLRERTAENNPLDIDTLSKSTVQKICRDLALDFCCLNYQLPPMCRQDDIPSCANGFQPRLHPNCAPETQSLTKISLPNRSSMYWCRGRRTVLHK